LKLVLVFNPAYSNSVFPFPKFNFPFIVDIFSYSVLFPIYPSSFVRSTVWPCKKTIPVLFIIYVKPFKSTTIWPSKHTLSMHFVIFPLSNILSFVCPCVSSKTFDSIFKISFKSACVWPCKFTLANLFPVDIFTFIG